MFAGGESSFLDKHMAGDQEAVWSKKQDHNGRGKVSYSKNLGSASQFLAKVGTDDVENKFIPTKDEKITYIKEEKQRDNKEKGQINYNYQDFLN